MAYVCVALSWVFCVLFALFTLSMILMGGWLQAIPLLGIVLLLLPPVWKLVQNKTGSPIPVWAGAIAFVVLLGLFVLLGSFNKVTSIYKSPEIQARFIEIYDQRLAEWPVPYESVFVDTEYGRVHVIVSGPQDAPPALLLHASGVSSWSWLYNIEALSQHFRTYAIDTIGDAGKSELTDIAHHVENGQDHARLHIEICDQLGIEQAYVIGASEGGFAGTNLALYAPERVTRLVLLGPMGYAGTNKAVIKIMLAQLFPLKPIQKGTMRWALGNQRVVSECGEWFELLMTGTMPKKARPTRFSPEQLQSLDVPVLLIFGQDDNLVGDPERAKALAQDIPDVRFEVAETGHLVGLDKPEQVNPLIIEFLKQP